MHLVWLSASNPHPSPIASTDTVIDFVKDSLIPFPAQNLFQVSMICGYRNASLTRYKTSQSAPLYSNWRHTQVGLKKPTFQPPVLVSEMFVLLFFADSVAHIVLELFPLPFFSHTEIGSWCINPLLAIFSDTPPHSGK